MSKTYKTTIGLEVHAELATKSKMFCGCKNDPHEGEPNSYICPVCLAHPGSLPVPNEEAIAMVLMFGKAVGAEAANFSEFDRKNYFYPDIPKAYQISQYAFPFLKGGSLLGVELTRVHLEEDTARSQHEHSGVSLVDFNRAGVPLMELVTEPVIHDAKTAGDFARELQLLLQTLGISKAQMERGEMRVEANISISNTDELGVKVEVKNLNSFKSVESAILYEVERHKSVIESGQKLVQETRGWDEVKLKTFSQRTKETAKDYRYFPDPDLPKMKVSEHTHFSPERLAEIMPELPAEKRSKYNDIGLPSNQTELIISNLLLSNYFSDLIKLKVEKSKQSELLMLSANYLTSDVLYLIQQGRQLLLEPNYFMELMEMVYCAKVNSRIAKDLLNDLIDTNQSPLEVAKEKKLLQASNPDELKQVILEIITENDAIVAEFRGGKDASLQFLIGCGMKKTRGTANPSILREELIRLIREPR